MRVARPVRRAGPRSTSSDVGRALRSNPYTEHRSNTCNLYICAIKEPFANRIVCCALDERMKPSLAARALRNAIRLRDPQGTIVYSNSGSQFSPPSCIASRATVTLRLVRPILHFGLKSVPYLGSTLDSG